MAALPRIVTVDPTGSVAQIVRSAITMLDALAVQIDVPSGNEAVEEVKRGRCNIVISNWNIDGTMAGWALAALIKKAADGTPLLILAEEDDPEVDEETQQNENAPFFYLRRPIEPQKLLRVMRAILNEGSVLDAMLEATPTATAPTDLGQVPYLDVKAAQSIVNGLLTDLGAMAIVLATREGEILLEGGATGYFDREKLTQSLLPLVTSYALVKDVVGGHPASFQFYDGDEFDVFVLSVGLHHFITVVFEGERGQKQFGAVTRFGRRACEDLIAMIPGAWTFQQPQVTTRPKPTKIEQKAEPEEVVHLEKAEFAAAEPTEPEPVIQQLEPISAAPDQLLSDIFGAGADESALNWDLDTMEDIAKESDNTDKVSFDDAIRIGLVSGGS